MNTATIFVNRRKGNDRRFDVDPCQAMPIDLFHRKRRKSADRRSERTLVEDYYAFFEKRTALPVVQPSTVCESDISE
ncbi:MAG: hypothetical protein ACRBBW_17905 [Cellvibrionaceae bacterium]